MKSLLKSVGPVRPEFFFSRWAALALLATSWFAQAAPGDADPAFAPVDVPNEAVFSIIEEPDKNLILAGNFTAIGAATVGRIARLNPNGTINASFNPGIGANNLIYAAARQPDGKIVAVGTFTQVSAQTRNRVVRFNADGTLDNTFNPGDGPNSNVYTLLVQSDGTILIGGSFSQVAGQARPYLARLQANGTLDTSFSPAPNNQVVALARTSDGKFLVGGDFTVMAGKPRARVVRFNADDSLDLSFDPGSGPNKTVRSIVPLSDGKVLLGGNFTDVNGVPRSYLCRLNRAGLPDLTFNAATIDNIVYSVASQPDGRVLASGEFTTVGGQLDARLLRLKSDGGLDVSFKANPGASSAIYTVVPAADGGFFVGGTFATYGGSPFARLAKVQEITTAPGGEIEFSSANYSVSEAQTTVNISVRRNGITTAGGSVDYATSNGTANVGDYVPQTGTLTFAAGETAKDIVLVLKPDDVIEGDETVNLTLSNPANGAALGSQPTAVLTILDDDVSPTVGLNAGSRDPDFNSSANGPVYKSFEQTDGRLLIGGDFTVINGESRQRLARLNADGSLDSSFNPAANFNGSVNALSVRADTKLFVGGSFSVVNGEAVARLARINANGTLDKSFVTGAGPNSSVYTVLPLPGDSVLVGGQFIVFNGQNRPYLVRVLADGSFDPTFDAQINSTVTSLVSTPDGKVLVGGSFTTAGGRTRNRIARFNPDGSLDLTFDPGNGPNSTVQSIVSQPSGKIFIVGNFSDINSLSRPYFAQLNSDGLADLNFTPAAPDNAVYTLAVQTDGKIVLGGEFTAVGGQAAGRVTRLRSDGSRDPSFVGLGANAIFAGVGADATVYSVRALNDGPIFVAGNFQQYDGANRARIVQLRDQSAVAGGEFEFTAAQYNVLESQPSVTIQVRRTGPTTKIASVDYATSNGTANIADYTPQSGKLTFAVGETLKSFIIPIKPDNNIEPDEVINLTLSNPSGSAVLGSVPTSVVVIVNDDFTTSLGSVDLNYIGVANGPVYATAIQADGKVLVVGDYSAIGGSARLRIARLNSDGSVDSAFNPTASLNGAAFAVALQSDGKILVAGSFTVVNGLSQNRLVRLNSDGTIDPTFTVAAGPNGAVYSILVLPDESILVGGGFGAVSGENRAFIAKLLSDGSVETGFNAAVNSTVYALASAPGDLVLAGGDFTSFGGQSRIRVARFNYDGVVDAAFNPGTGPNSTVRSIVVQTDAKALIGGFFTDVKGAGRPYLCRLSVNGEPDLTFGPANFDNVVYSIGLQSDGKIVAGGEFSTVGGVATGRVIRLLGDGKPDPSLSVGTGANGSVYAVRVQADGQILVGGNFTQFSGINRPRWVRILGAINQRFRFTTIDAAADSVTVIGQGTVGLRYALESSSDLSLWTPITTNTAVITQVTFIDPSPAPALRYYRAVVR